MPDSTSQSLRIAIVGAGQIGSAFAFQLARIGDHNISVVARPGSTRLQQLRRDGAIVDVKGERAPISVTDTLDETAPYDLVLVTLLAHQTDAVLPNLRRSAAACILFMGNTFDPDRLQAAVGVERCAFGMPFVQAVLNPEGRLKVTIGAGGQKTIMSQQRWVDIFGSAGLPAAHEPNMKLWLRCHVPVCVAFESVAVAGMKRGGGASWGEALILAKGVHASFTLIKALGYDLYPSTKRRMAGSPTAAVAAVLWFMSRIRSFRELLATGKAECCALIETMVAAAPLAKTPIDVSDIRAMRPS
jgi:2-dehydropantoate 2-reductase